MGRADGYAEKSLLNPNITLKNIPKKLSQSTTLHYTTLVAVVLWWCIDRFEATQSVARKFNAGTAKHKQIYNLPNKSKSKSPPSTPNRAYIDQSEIIEHMIFYYR